MTCPECSDAQLRYQQHQSREPHGELWHQEWWECPQCGEKFSDEDLERATRS